MDGWGAEKECRGKRPNSMKNVSEVGTLLVTDETQDVVEIDVRQVVVFTIVKVSTGLVSDFMVLYDHLR